jgi:hypothetical protein
LLLGQLLTIIWNSYDCISSVCCPVDDERGVRLLTLSKFNAKLNGVIFLKIFSTQALIQNWTLITGIIFPTRDEGVPKTKDPHLEEMEKVS